MSYLAYNREYDVYSESDYDTSDDEISEYRFDEDGYDINGYNAHGYLNLERSPYSDEERYDDIYRFNEEGYDIDGYDADGYDTDGFDPDGYDADGYDADGYDTDGYDTDGYDADGYDAAGFDRDGYDRDHRILKPHEIKKNQRYWGHFSCLKCGNCWTSAYTYKGYQQGCKRCGKKAKVHSQRRLLRSKGNSKSQHDEARCGKCQELRYSCKLLSDIENLRI